MSDENMKNMMCLDIYLNSLAPDEQKNIQLKLLKPLKSRHPLMCWDMVVMQRALEEKKLKYRQCDLELLEKLKIKFSWDICVPELLDAQYDALVLTDNRIIIRWVNDGFFSMTGYRAEESIGRSPRFLQGPLTSDDSRERIRRGLASSKPFSDKVINYKKDGQTYVCLVNIYPLTSRKNTITHYLALESNYH
jgi:PAS domain S-box-containing protein